VTASHIHRRRRQYTGVRGGRASIHQRALARLYERRDVCDVGPNLDANHDAPRRDLDRAASGPRPGGWDRDLDRRSPPNLRTASTARISGACCSVIGRYRRRTFARVARPGSPTPSKRRVRDPLALLEASRRQAASSLLVLNPFFGPPCLERPLVRAFCAISGAVVLASTMSQCCAVLRPSCRENLAIGLGHSVLRRSEIQVESDALRM
jgi:hypothetical protein